LYDGDLAAGKFVDDVAGGVFLRELGGVAHARLDVGLHLFFMARQAVVLRKAGHAGEDRRQ
jgi:hypothetical protein